MKKFLAVVSFAALLCPSLSEAAVISEPRAFLLVNGVDSGIVFDWRTTDNKVFTLDYVSTSGPLRDLHVIGDSDPFLNYTLSFVEPFNSTTAVSLTIVMPYTGGPYDLVTNSHSSTASDGLRDGGTVGLNVDAHIANALLDAATVSGLSTGCAIAPAAVGQTCFSGPDATVGVSSNASGIFGVRVTFTLSPLDAYAAEGRVTLTSVPEPATLLLLGTGIAAILRRRVVN